MQAMHVYDAKLILVIEVGRLVLVEIVKHLSVLHPDSASTRADIALAEVLTKNPTVNLDCLKWTVNQSKVNTTSVQIEELDVTSLCAILLNKKLGFLEHLECCCNLGGIRKCKHAHGCVVVGGCKGAECIRLACKYCGTDSKICKRMIYWRCTHTIKITRNRKNHSTIEDYKNFENKTKFFKDDFPSATTWVELWNIINDAIQPCIHLLCAEGIIVQDVMEDLKLDMQIALRKNNPLTLLASSSTALGNEKESKIKHFIEEQNNKQYELIKKLVMREGEPSNITSVNNRKDPDCVEFIVGEDDSDVVRIDRKELRNFVCFEKIPNGVIFQLPEDLSETIKVLQIKISIKTDETTEQNITENGWDNVARNDISLFNGELTVKNLKKERFNFLALLEDVDDERIVFSGDNILITDEKKLSDHVSNNNSKTVLAICHNYGLPTDLHQVLDCAIPKNTSSISLDDISYVKGSGTVRGKLSGALTYLSDNFKDQNVICFPEIDKIQIDRNLKNLVEKIRKYYMSQNKQKRATCVIFPQYNANKHFKVTGKTARACGISLDAKDDGKNRVLIMDEEFQAIINIRMSEGIDVTDLKKDFKRCHEDLKSVNFLHSDLLETKQVSFLSLVATYHVKQEKRKNCFCETCSNMILFQEQLNDENQFKQFWEKNVLDKIVTALHSQQMLIHPKSIQTRNNFLQVANRIMVIMSLSKAFLPSAYGTDHEKIESLLFNKVQKQAIAEEGKRKIIAGSYGSGKSLVLQKILEKTYKDPSLEGAIYTIIWDEYSLMFAQLHSECEELKKITENENPTAQLHCTNIVDLSEERGDGILMSLENVLEHLAAKHEPETKIHIFVEEFDPESIGEVEGNRLNEILQKDCYKDSYFIVTIQSLLKKRTSYTDSTSSLGLFGKQLSIDHKTNQIKLIKNIQKYELPSTMRFTVAAHKLVTMSQHVISTMGNIYAEPKLRKFGNSVAKKRESNHDNRSNPTTDADSAIPGSSSTMNQPHIPLRIDKLGKYVANQKPTSIGGSENYIQTSFHFTDSQGCGHKIAGTKPLIVRVPAEYNSHTLEGINGVTSILNQFLLRMEKSLFICNDSNIIRIIQASLETLQIEVLDYLHNLYGKYPGSECKIKTYTEWKEKTNIALLTENRGACGLQHDKVYYIVDEEDKHEYFLLPEAVSRTTNNLVIISFRCRDEVKKKSMKLKRAKGKSMFSKMADTYCYSAYDVIEELLCENVIEDRPFEQFTVETFIDSLPENISEENFKRYIDPKTAWESMKKCIAQKNSEHLTYEEQMKNRTLQELLKHLENRKFQEFNDLIRLDKTRAKLYDNFGRSLLHFAAAYGATECVDGLLATGCSVRCRDNYGYFPIHYATQENKMEMTKKLLQADNNTINAICRGRETPLHKATYRNHVEIVELLLSYPNIKAKMKNWDSKYPEQWTSSRQIKELLTEHYKTLNQ